jgi:hypothetical protein
VIAGELEVAAALAAAGADVAVTVRPEEQAVTPSEIATAATPTTRLFRLAGSIPITTMCSIHVGSRPQMLLHCGPESVLGGENSMRDEAREWMRSWVNTHLLVKLTRSTREVGGVDYSTSRNWRPKSGQTNPLDHTCIRPVTGR